jgi:catechol 2,3-dioxygenase-like lactoylglutathione lyase family enzyme
VTDLDQTVKFYEELGFRIGKREANQATYGAALAKGFTPETEPRKQRSGTREFLLHDPDGNKLTFFAK